MPQFSGQLAAPVQSLRSLVNEVVVAENLSDFGQVNHVAVVQAVIVNVVLVEKRLGKVLYLVPLHTIELVVAQDHANGLHLAAPDSSGDYGAILVGLHKGRPSATLNHVAEDFIETVKGCPVEYTQIAPLILLKLLPSDLLAHDDHLFTFLRCLAPFALFFPKCQWSHLHAFAWYKWLHLGIFGFSYVFIANIRQHIIASFFHFEFILLDYLLLKPNSESFDGLTVAHKACHVNGRNIVHVKLHDCFIVEKQLH